MVISSNQGSSEAKREQTNKTNKAICIKFINTRTKCNMPWVSPFLACENCGSPGALWRRRKKGGRTPGELAGGPLSTPF